jgi:hypothetical protein
MTVGNDTPELRILDGINSNVMDLNHYPNVWPNLQPTLEAALLQHEEAVAKLAAFKKQYTSVKSKAKRVEKFVATLDEETFKYYQLHMLNCVRLAENKFALIDKKWNRFKKYEQRSCDASLRSLKGRFMEPNMTQWHIQHVSGYARTANELLREVGNMLRIAKDHLHKVDDMKKSMKKYLGFRRPN